MGGRKKGVANALSKELQEQRELARQFVETNGMETPLQLLLREMNDNKNKRDFRVHCAIAAAPYCHRKMPTGIEINPNAAKSVSRESFYHLSSDELAEFVRLTEKLGNQVIDVTAREVPQLPGE